MGVLLSGFSCPGVPIVRSLLPERGSVVHIKKGYIPTGDPSLLQKPGQKFLEMKEWSKMQVSLRAARDRHIQSAQGKVSRFISDTEKRYSAEVDRFVDWFLRDKALRKMLEPILEETRAYLFWLRWVSWNISNLAPVVYEDTTDASRRLALGMLAYSAGRLIDDGLDNHDIFKGHRATVLAALRKHAPHLSVGACCAQSSFLGFCVFSYALVRMRDCKERETASIISRWFEEMSPGVFAEATGPQKLSRATYLRIVRRKAVYYNMILYEPLLQEVERPLQSNLLGILASLDELAQILNDYVDWDADKRDGQMNAFVLGLYTQVDLPVEVRMRIRKLWQAALALPCRLQDAVAAMIENLSLGNLLDVV